MGWGFPSDVALPLWEGTLVWREEDGIVGPAKSDLLYNIYVLQAEGIDWRTWRSWHVPVMIEMGTLAIFTSSMSAFKVLAAGSEPSAATSMGGASSSSSMAAKEEFLQQ